MEPRGPDYSKILLAGYDPTCYTHQVPASRPRTPPYRDHVIAASLKLDIRDEGIGGDRRLSVIALKFGGKEREPQMPRLRSG